MNSRGGRILDPSGSDDRSFGEIRDQEGTIRDADEPSPKRTIKSLEALTKEMIGVGTGIRGGGSSYAHTQGQGNSTQVTIVPPRPEDDRVASKKVKNRKE